MAFKPLFHISRKISFAAFPETVPSRTRPHPRLPTWGTVRRGHDVVVFTQPHGDGEVELPGVQVLPVLRLRYANDRLLPKRYKMDVWHVMNACYAWLALETRPVVVSVHGNDFINPCVLIHSPSLKGVPVLWRFHQRIGPYERWLHRRLALRLMRRGLSRSRQVIANSEYSKQLVIKLYPMCRNRTSVGFVGVGEDFLNETAKRADFEATKRLVTVCRLGESRKNVDRILQALAELKHYPFTYTVVGEGKLRPSLEALSRDLGLRDRVTFTGFLPKVDVQNLLASSDLFILTSSVLPHSFEGFGIVYLEANACGTPVLAARQAGAAEAVADGVSGMFVNEPTVEEIASALERFFSGEIHFVSDACRTFARRFTWQRVVDHAIQHYGVIQMPQRYRCDL